MKNYREPCVLLADQPSMRSGDSAYFMQKWCKSQNNTLIVVEPDLDFNSLIAPYQVTFKAQFFFAYIHFLILQTLS